ILKLGDRYRCCQLQMFASEVAKSWIVRQEQCNNQTNDMFCGLMLNKKYLVEPIFSKLVSIIVFQSTCVTDHCRDIILYSVVGGSAMRSFNWRACGNQSHHSKPFFDWLFQCSYNLNSYQLTTRIGQIGFEIKHEHTIVNGYVPHRSLINLKISIVNLTILHILLHYLPRLQHLDVSVTNKIAVTDLTEHLPARLNHPKELRTLKLRQIPFDLSIALQPFWYNMRRSLLTFDEKQLLFLRSLQCTSPHNRE
ncbi:unnamed protein product, partial [Rotaria magnacalcarata]